MAGSASSDSGPVFKVLAVGLDRWFCDSLGSMAGLSLNLSWLGMVHTLEEARVIARTTPPDLVCLRIPLRVPRQKRAVRSLMGAESPPRLVALCRTVTDDLQCEALCMGASALISLDGSMEYIVSTIKKILKGEAPIEYALIGSLSLAARVRQRLQELVAFGGDRSQPQQLSDRERGILSEIASGRTNKEIGALLGMHEQSVKNCNSAMLKKMGARDRAHAVTLALSHGWITPP